MTIFQIKRVPSKLIPHIWSLRNEIVKIGTGPLEGDFKAIHYGLIQYSSLYIDICLKDTNVNNLCSRRHCK